MSDGSFISLVFIAMVGFGMLMVWVLAQWLRTDDAAEIAEQDALQAVAAASRAATLAEPVLAAPGLDTAPWTASEEALIQTLGWGTLIGAFLGMVVGGVAGGFTGVFLGSIVGSTLGVAMGVVVSRLTHVTEAPPVEIQVVARDSHLVPVTAPDAGWRDLEIVPNSNDVPAPRPDTTTPGAA